MITCINPNFEQCRHELRQHQCLMGQPSMILLAEPRDTIYQRQRQNFHPSDRPRNQALRSDTIFGNLSGLSIKTVTLHVINVIWINTRASDKTLSTTAEKEQNPTHLYVVMHLEILPCPIFICQRRQCYDEKGYFMQWILFETDSGAHCISG